MLRHVHDKQPTVTLRVAWICAPPTSDCDRVIPDKKREPVTTIVTLLTLVVFELMNEFRM